MIQLPQLQIERDEYQEAAVFVKLKEWLAKEDKNRSSDIHASDLLDPLYAYWQRKTPKDLTERQVYFFVIGKILHLLVLQSFTGSEEIAFDSGTHKSLDILFSPDGHLADGKPLELKTHRGLREPKDIQDSFGHYFEQLCTYLVLENRLEGQLWTLYINLQDRSGRTFPELRCHTVTLSEEQFYGIEQQVLSTRDALADAIERSDPSGLQICRSWKCSTTCGFWHDCKPAGRYPGTDKRRWTA